MAVPPLWLRLQGSPVRCSAASSDNQFPAVKFRVPPLMVTSPLPPVPGSNEVLPFTVQLLPMTNPPVPVDGVPNLLAGFRRWW